MSDPPQQALRNDHQKTEQMESLAAVMRKRAGC